MPELPSIVEYARPLSVPSSIEPAIELFVVSVVGSLGVVGNVSVD